MTVSGPSRSRMTRRRGMGNGIGYFTGGKVFDYEKGKSPCTMNVTKLTPTLLQGNAECRWLTTNSARGRAPSPQ